MLHPRKMFALACLYLLLSLVDLAESECPSDWIIRGDYCYHYHDIAYATSGMSWNDSRLACQRYGGDLVVIRNQDEQNFLTANMTQSQKRQHYWIGLSDQASEGNFEWVDGTSIAATGSNWRTSAGEPDNLGGNEDCVELHDDGKWNDNWCERSFAFICQKHKDTPIPTALPLPPLPSSGQVICKAGWHGFNNSCYLFQKERKTWAEGRKDCQKRGGDLVIVDSAEEHDFLADSIISDDGALTYYWIGLTDKYTEGTFYWVDQTKLHDNISFWRPKQPNNAFGGEDCVEMCSSRLFTGSWNDNRCSANRYYICEKIPGKSMCPEDWITYDDMCYQVNAHPEQKKTWLEANDACKSYEDANLISLHDLRTVQKISQSFHDVFVTNGYYWHGLNDKNKEGHFAWTDQSNYEFSNWGFNEQRKNTNNLDCVKAELRTFRGLWSLANCNSTSEMNYYVCARKREYTRCNNPLGMENHAISNDQISASSEKSATTPAASGRRNAVKAHGLDGAWCAATNDQNQWLRIDMKELYSVTFVKIQGHPRSNAYVKSFYLKYSPDMRRWSVYGYSPPSKPYKILQGNKFSDRSIGATAELKPSIKARYLEFHPISWSLGICMRVELYGCPAVTGNSKCGHSWTRNKVLNACYKIGMTSLPWTAARAKCLLENGDLLSITSFEEKEYVNELFLKNWRRSFWIGLNSRDSKYVYTWSDGSALTTVRWHSGYPVRWENGTEPKSCVALSASRRYWYNIECSLDKAYICKRKLQIAKAPKKKFTGNWISETDYYWPFDDTVNNKIAGTIQGLFYGTVNFSAGVNGRQAIVFDGTTSYVKVAGLRRTCISDPTRCTNGVTYSMMLNLDPSLTSTPRTLYILDSMGQGQSDAAGLYVYISNGQLGVFVRSTYHTWHSIVTPVLGKWTHFAFVWNEQAGLVVYLDGERKVNDNAGTRTPVSVLNDRVTDLYIGKSSSNGAQTNVKFKMMSLAIWEKSLSASEINDIYIFEMGGCRAGWLPFGQDCFQFNTWSIHYDSAKIFCEAKGGTLAIIKTSLQQAFLITGIRATKTISFIGLRLNDNGFYEWDDASPVWFSNWEQNIPRAYAFWRFRRYFHVAMTVSQSGRWINRQYDMASYICQRNKEIMNGSTSSTPIRNSTIRRGTVRYYCRYGTRLSVLTAFYGKPPECPYTNVLSTVKNLCSVRKRSCSINFLRDFPTKCPGGQLKISLKCEVDSSFLQNTECDSQWQTMEGSIFCYKLKQVKLNWTDADAYCKSKGAQLVSLQSKSEEIYLASLLINSFELMNIWIGYNDRAMRGNYVWSDNAQSTYTNWFNGQPDDAARRGSCVKASLNQGYRGFLSWTDDDCSTLNSFMCKKLKAKMTTAKPQTTRTRKSTSSCLSGWFRYKNSCYQFSSRNATWDEANSICQKQGAYLATISSYEENEAVFNFLVNSTLESVWIGLQDKGVFTGQQWADESPVNFVRWDSGQPDSNLGQQACTLMASNGFWQDNDCYVKRYYLCKTQIGNSKIIPTAKTPVAPTENLKYCPKKWVWSSTTGNCYFFSSRTHFVSWTDARSFCRSTKGDLASIESSAEQSYLEQFLLTFSRKNAWIGLSDLGMESGWEWSDGKPASYFNWQSGQPDDWSQMEDCAQMRRGGQWDDRNCGEKASFMCKKANNSVVIPSTIPPTAGPLKGYCESGWLHYKSKCYKLNADDNLSWMAARNACRAETTDGKHGDLASIHSVYESAFLFSQMNGISSNLFIGLNDIKTEGEFQWSDQSNVDFINWQRGQPDNYRNNEDCTHLYKYMTFNGKWNDLSCSDEIGYICQKDASSKPPSVAPTTAPKDPCPKGYMQYQKNCYSFKKQLMTWDEAVAFCRKEDTNSDLASIHNEFEAAYVFSHVGEYASRVWIGLHRPNKETKFRWSNSQPLDFTDWSAFPVRRRLHLRSCVISFYNSRGSGYWVDGSCIARNPFVCKITRETVIKPEHPGTCPSGWRKFDRHCYFLENNPIRRISWSEARKQCLDKGADLASIHSTAEQNFIHNTLWPSDGRIWIGLNDRRIEKQMVWSDGSPFDYSYWDTGEPSDNAGVQNCIEMYGSVGGWNDLSCSKERGFVCKKELGCDDSFGMENRTIKDSQIIASSVYSNKFAQDARLNSDSGWCANFFNRKQFIQVDFGQTKRLTRIATQGLSPNFVLSYKLYYSDDGKNWQVYKVDGRAGILPGNRASHTTDGVALKPPVSARFIRINPLTWRHRICMRLEFYGCNYVCYQPLGLESGAIRNYEINASSAEPPNMPYDARFRNPNGQGWCAQSQNAEQWLQIHLSSNPVSVTKVATQGVTVEGKSYSVTAYSLSYSDDGVTWTPYKTLKGEIRIFSGSSFPETGVFHSLTQPFTGRHIRFKPLSWNKKICMRVEVFGCPYNCDKTLGIASGNIPDKAITASSSLEKHLPPSARLNQGSFNMGSWCAKVNDQQQYIQFDLGAESRIAAVATQGFKADTLKYVTEFWIQFSMDGKFWNLYHANGVIETIKGNSDGSTVKKTELPSHIRARYIRLNPRHWKQGICMRVELYGCPLKEVVYPTDAPVPKTKLISGKLILRNEKYMKEYGNKDSKQFKNMANRIETAITQLYASNFVFKRGFYGVQVTKLSPGSIVVSFTMVFKTNDNNATWPLKVAISNGKLGDFHVDKDSLHFSNGDDGNKEDKSLHNVTREGLSAGGKIALIVVFMLLVVAAIAAGMFYYFKRRSKSQFSHETFQNAVHFTSEAYSVSGEKVDNLPSQN